jgi:hypothetical protein
MVSPELESGFNIQNVRRFSLLFFEVNEWGVQIWLPFFSALKTYHLHTDKVYPYLLRNYQEND